MIVSKCNEYEHYVEELELVRELDEAEFDDAYDATAPGKQQEDGDTAEASVQSETVVYINLDRAPEQRHYAIGNEI